MPNPTAIEMMKFTNREMARPPTRQGVPATSELPQQQPDTVSQKGWDAAYSNPVIWILAGVVMTLSWLLGAVIDWLFFPDLSELQFYIDAAQFGGWS